MALASTNWHGLEADSMKIHKADYLTMQLIADRLGCERTAEKICAAISKLQNEAAMSRIEIERLHAANVIKVDAAG